MVAGMTVGGWRRTYWFAFWPKLPDNVAPEPKPGEKLFVEFRLESAGDR